MILDALKGLLEKQAKTEAARVQMLAADAAKKAFEACKAEEQSLVDELVHHLQKEGYKINPLSDAELNPPATPAPAPVAPAPQEPPAIPAPAPATPDAPVAPADAAPSRIPS